MSAVNRSTRTALLAAAALALAAAAASADDRQLLRSGSGSPYVLVLLDSSGSMNWSPPCSAADYAAGICTWLCPTGDCPVPRDGDDPASKMRQAKEALYEVLGSLDNINYGFATYNQDDLYVTQKHWLYRVAASQPTGFFALAGGVVFPAAGTDEVFGPSLTCNIGTGDANIACFPPAGTAANACGGNGSVCNPADWNDAWEITRFRRLPRLAANGSTTSNFYLRVPSSSTRYRVRYSGAVAYGSAQITVDVQIAPCTNNKCTTVGAATTKSIVYDRVGDFTIWDYQVQRNPPQSGYVDFQEHTASNTCAGWDPNTDTGSDNHSGYSLRYPAGAITFDPPGTVNDSRYTTGDVLPLDWNNDNKLALLNRLAPRLNGGDPATDPEAFAVATYLRDLPLAGQTYLRLKDEGQRPIIPEGSTPLGNSFVSIRTWFHGCNSTNCSGGAIGWKDVAAQQDPKWECRKKFILLLTDGDETCSGNPATTAGLLNQQDDVHTFVIGFGLPSGPGNTLDPIAAAGGTTQAYFPRNKAELIAAIGAALSQIQEQTVAFASAAVPTVQADIADKTYLSSFTPLNLTAVWPGRLDAFLKPLPTTDGLPRRDTVCQLGSVEAECFAWDAGDSQPAFDDDGSGYAPRGLLLQAPIESAITLLDNSTLQLGNGLDQRRVYFGLPAATAAGKRQLFRFPETPAEQLEYEFVWNLPAPLGSTANRDTIADVVAYTLKEKRGLIDNPDDTNNPFHVQYLLGDIFHSNPVILNPPASFDLYTQDLYWNTPLCGQDLATTRQRFPRVSYDWFSNKNLCRRVMLFVGSDDGQLHAFDAGIFRGGDCKLNLPFDWDDNTLADTSGTTGAYDFGSGREIFSFIPSAQMPVVKELSEISELTTQYGIDGSPRVADVFVDPVLDNSGNPACGDREWRTLLFGTYREGGPGFFALDVTQPDVINTGSGVPEALNYQPSCSASDGSCGYVPSCTDGGANCGPLPFPALRWEFRDTSDEDGVGGADEAESWSRPFIARLKVCEGACDQANEPEDRWVAVFGGGLPENPTNTSSDDSGNWIYMVDVETGRIVYKRGGDGVIAGAVAADVTGVDANSNGLVDTLYFGTTAGFVYKVNLGEGPFELDNAGRIPDPAGLAGLYDPFQVFSTGGRPIYLEVSSVFVPKLRATALLFGTGDRWNLWEFNSIRARFYAIVDTGWHDTNRDGVLDPVGCGTCTQPLTEASLESIDPDSPFSLASPGPNYLFGNPNPAKLPGWFFPLGVDEKLITEPFSLSGITFFTVYDPVSSEVAGVCALGGESKIFTVNTANAIGYARAGTEYLRYISAPQFTTQPFTEQSATGNQGGTGGGTTADDWTDELREINAQLKKLFPSSCRFSNYTLDIKTIRSDTGIVFIAPVPICVEGHNWKEF